jgi:hypothetical protein
MVLVDIWTDVADIQERSLAEGLGPFSIPVNSSPSRVLRGSAIHPSL